MNTVLDSVFNVESDGHLGNGRCRFRFRVIAIVNLPLAGGSTVVCVHGYTWYTTYVSSLRALCNILQITKTDGPRAHTTRQDRGRDAHTALPGTHTPHDTRHSTATSLPKLYALSERALARRPTRSHTPRPSHYHAYMGPRETATSTPTHGSRQSTMRHPAPLPSPRQVAVRRATQGASALPARDHDHTLRAHETVHRAPAPHGVASTASSSESLPRGGAAPRRAPSIHTIH